MKKKIIRIVGVIVILVVALLVAIPFFLEAKIGDIIKNNVNRNVNATLEFSKADLSLISAFPNASVALEDVSLVNKAPFEGDTLFAAKNVSMTMGIMQLFNGADESIAINTLTVNDALLHIKVDEQENANYDIAIAFSQPATNTSVATDGFSFNMENYEISDSKILYDDFIIYMLPTKRLTLASLYRSC